MIVAVQHLQILSLLSYPAPYTGQEPILQQLSNCRSLRRILLQAPSQKSLQLLRSPAHSFGWSSRDHNHRHERLHVQVAGFSLAELYQDDSQGPNVDTFGVVFFFDEFGGHPGWCASDFLRRRFFFGELECIAKVSYFDISVLIDEDIITFEVSMDLPPAVDGAESFEDFPDDVGDDPFVDVFAVALDELVEGPPIHILDEHKKCLLVVVGKVMLDDIVRLAHVHYCYLLFYLHQEWFVLDCDYPHRKNVGGVSLMAGFVDLAGVSLAQLAHKCELCRRLLLYKLDPSQFLSELTRSQQSFLKLALVDRTVSVIGNNLQYFAFFLFVIFGEKGGFGVLEVAVLDQTIFDVLGGFLFFHLSLLLLLPFHLHHTAMYALEQDLAISDIFHNLIRQFLRLSIFLVFLKAKTPRHALTRLHRHRRTKALRLLAGQTFTFHHH